MFVCLKQREDVDGGGRLQVFRAAYDRPNGGFKETAINTQ